MRQQKRFWYDLSTIGSAPIPPTHEAKPGVMGTIHGVTSNHSSSDRYSICIISLPWIPEKYNLHFEPELKTFHERIAMPTLRLTASQSEGLLFFVWLVLRNKSRPRSSDERESLPHFLALFGKAHLSRFVGNRRRNVLSTLKSTTKNRTGGKIEEEKQKKENGKEGTRIYSGIQGTDQ